MLGPLFLIQYTCFFMSPSLCLLLVFALPCLSFSACPSLRVLLCLLFRTCSDVSPLFLLRCLWFALSDWVCLIRSVWFGVFGLLCLVRCVWSAVSDSLCLLRFLPCFSCVFLNTTYCLLPISCLLVLAIRRLSHVADPCRDDPNRRGDRA